jgi:hypothetical protein
VLERRRHRVRPEHWVLPGSVRTRSAMNGT